MARKAEKGISYFPLNTDITMNDKLKLVVLEFGPKAWCVYIPLLAKIYREKGYYIDWKDSDTQILFSNDEARCEVGYVREVVAGCIKRGIFDEAVFNAFGILTSDRIQENYVEAKKRSPQPVEMYIEYLLIGGENASNLKNVALININVDINPKKAGINPQNKRKEKKEKENESMSAEAHTPEQVEVFKLFMQWMDQKAPRVNQLKEKLTIDQFLKLRDKYSKETIKTVLLAMQNNAALTKKYVSAYLTINNWAARETSSPKGAEPPKLTAESDKKSMEILNSQ